MDLTVCGGDHHERHRYALTLDRRHVNNTSQFQQRRVTIRGLRATTNQLRQAHSGLRSLRVNGPRVLSYYVSVMGRLRQLSGHRHQQHQHYGSRLLDARNGGQRRDHRHRNGCPSGFVRVLCVCRSFGAL